MARASKSDPIRDFKFLVEILPEGNLKTVTSGIENLGFAVVSGLSVQNEVIPYREGGMNTHPHKLVGQSDFAPVTFSRGTFFNQTSLYRWQQFMHSWTGTGLSASGNNDYRCTIGVRVLDHPVSKVEYVTDPSTNGNNLTVSSDLEMRLGFVIYNAWPGAFALSDLNAGNSGILVQQLTVHHEGFVIVNSTSEYNTAVSR